jgi:2-hydroxychromene-2-carboxylate isomerase
MARARRPPRLYFSFRSPFSWMALRRLEERLPAAPELIEYVPYWDPDEKLAAALDERGSGFHYTRMSKAKHLYILQDTKRLAQRHGYAMTWPIDVDPWWDLPHLAWLRAKESGVHRELYAAVCAARWERGENVCEPEVLHAVLSGAGLDADALVAAGTDDGVRSRGLDALAAAYDDDVFGIPYFKLGRHRFWGLDRLDGFLDALGGTVEVPTRNPEEDPLEGIPAAAREQVGAYDFDEAGGCG